MNRMIRDLREERGESRAALAAALGVTSEEVVEWEMGKTEPTILRLGALTGHFGVRDDQITLRPGDPPSLVDRLAEFL